MAKEVTKEGRRPRSVVANASPKPALHHEKLVQFVGFLKDFYRISILRIFSYA